MVHYSGFNSLIWPEVQSKKDEVWLWKVSLADKYLYDNTDSNWWYKLPLDKIEESSIWKDDDIEITVVSFEPET